LVPTAQRLRDPALFKAAVRRGRRAGSDTLVVHWQAGPSGAGPVQAGLVVSRAVGNAVTRNLVKRRLRHLIREQLDHASAVPDSGVLVVRALSNSATAPFSELRDDFERCLGRVVS
jgi:ribonuclease P protein component